MHEVSAKDGTNVEDFVSCIGSEIARAGGGGGSASPSPSALDAPQIRVPAAAAPAPAPQPAAVAAGPSPPAAALSVEQQHAISEAAEAAAEAVSRVGALEEGFGELTQNFEAALGKVIAQQTANTQAIAAAAQADDGAEEKAQEEVEREERRRAALAELSDRLDRTDAAVAETARAETLATEERLGARVGAVEAGVAACEGRLGGVEAELAECALEAASAAERVGVKAASAVESAVGEASEALRDELRRVEAEWERRVAEIETDVETVSAAAS